MSIEKERKFLVRDTSFKTLAISCTHIIQGYLSSNPERTVRLRLRDDKAYITIKGPSTADGLERFEWETEIAVADAQAMLPLCETGTIDKHRYIVPFGGYEWEIDVFHGDNEGLVMAELELDKDEYEVPLPDFLGEEVTGDSRFYNSNLKTCPYKFWE